MSSTVTRARVRARVLSAVVAVAALVAVVGAAPPATATTVALSGTVTLADGTPLSDAHVGVLIEDANSQWQYTDDAGGFGVAVAPGARTRIAVFDDQFRGVWGWAGNAAGTTFVYDEASAYRFTVPADGLTGLHISVPPAVSVSGTLDLTNNLAPGCCQVTAEVVGTGPRTESTTTDDRFSVRGLAAGTSFRLQVTDSTGAIQNGYLAAGSTSAFTTDPAKARTFVATATGLSGIAITPKPAGTISGTLTDLAGAPLAGVMVTSRAATDGFAFGGHSTTDQSGAYRVGGLVPGERYVLSLWGTQVVSDAYLTGVAAAPLATSWASAGRFTAGAVVSAKLAPPLYVTGRVTNASGLPLAGIKVDAMAASGERVTTTATDGTYVIGGLLPGTYTVRFIDEAGTYLPAALPPVVLTSDGAVDRNLTMQVGVSVTGRITRADGTPLPGIRVASEGAEARTGADGRYTLFPLVPGSKISVHVEDPNQKYIGGAITTRPDKLIIPSSTEPPVVTVGAAGSAGVDGVLAATSPAVQFTLSPDLAGVGYGAILSVQPDGILVSRPTYLSTPQLYAPVPLGTGFADKSVFAPGDWNGDRKADVITVNPAGYMDLYRGSGTGAIAAPTRIGNGWNGYRVIPAGDLTRDHINDLLAIDPAGNLKLYAGNGKGGFKYPYPQVGNGWNGFKLYAAGDVTFDGKADILSVDSSGRLWLYAGRGDGRFLTKKQVGNGWGTYTLAAGADLNGDLISDIVGRDNKTGTLYVYKGQGSGLFLTKVAIASGW